MRLILTHEQADFDAIASLLAASLLDNGAIPVLPRKLNRNVRSFLTIYGQELPFVDVRDLQPGKIESVTLVDTQSLVTIKGMVKTTRVKIIDHHPVRHDIHMDNEVVFADTGSTTTILAELISEEQLALTISQATLLLLGVYEDTGSLTYAGTTGRDVRVAAYLLDQGANLQIAGNFLNPPLTIEQRLFYDTLSSNAKVYSVNGHRIVITTGDLSESIDEISTLAHKLRDLLDPDGLFVIVSTSEGIRLVARSTTDQIDVGEIASHFGGGGHDRAAAALIHVPENKGKNEMIDQLIQELLTILPEYVRPSITVSQIMSRSPHVLSPDTPVNEASRLMQFYGYEGYPVVDKGMVIGLLTRRAVDKALNHKLNISAAGLMDAKEIWVSPDDSIQHLQTIMAESGWGQVPVIDPTTHTMVGIVTRTDLIKMLSPKASGSGRVNLEDKLDRALSPRLMALIHSVAEEAITQRSAIYIVGGFVRDLLLEKPSIDFDIVVEGDAIQIAKLLAEKHGGRVIVHSRFGTAKWYLPVIENTEEHVPEFLDFITARMEFYAHPTALPTVERSSIRFDLHRRDFTINTLAIRLDGTHFGELYDYWGGQNDLKEQQIRVLHSLSFVDDPTRMLRAVRFEQRFGFQIEKRTLKLLQDAKGLLESLSGDRIRHEINLMFDESNIPGIFSRLEDLQLLEAIHPSLPWNEFIQQDLSEKIDLTPEVLWGQNSNFWFRSDRRTRGYLLWLSDLSEVELIPVGRRLRLSHSLMKNLLSIQKIITRLPGLVDSFPSKICMELDESSLLSVFMAYLKVNNDSKIILEKYLLTWRRLGPKTTGDDLKERGLPPGPVYQDILFRLRSAWLDGEIHSVEMENRLLDEILGSIKTEDA